VPVRHPDGDLYGTLCGLSHTSQEFRDRDVRFLEVLATLIAGELRRDPGAVERRRRHARQIALALDGTGVDIHLQPIVRLGDQALVGFEALARFDGHEPPRGPDEWFAAAWDVGLGERLEIVAVRKALALLDAIPAGTYLSVNADPRTVVSAPFRDALTAVPAARIIVELTEHSAVADYGVLAEAIAVLRGLGARFAIDDVGAGYAGLNHIMRVGPEVLKLDRFLIGGVDGDPARRALVAAAAAFARATRTRVIAEGIETAGELAALHTAGIRYGQGFHLGRPAAAEAFAAAG
jgi:EAL domain-containing protein (putative c-di-GMP-specific phosphodiesterase class I)